MTIDGTPFRFLDHPGSTGVSSVVEDFERHYAVSRIPFRPGDTVVDIGAHVGVVSVFIAKRFPGVHVYAFEPIPDNYRRLVENVRLNRVRNLQAFNLAVTADGRDFDMIAHLPSNSGGGTGYLHDLRLPEHSYYTVPSTTLDAILERHGIEHCRLLKIDCEGGEHEILLSSRKLDRVEYLAAEVHINSHLEGLGYSIEGLLEHCYGHIAPEKISHVAIRMQDQ